MPSDSSFHDLALDCSPFLTRLAQRYPEWLPELKAEGRLAGGEGPGSGELARAVAEHGLDPGLRRFRNREMLRITWRELNRVASLEQTLAELSRLAEICLAAAIEHHEPILRQRHGTPRDADGQSQALVVLGLGKLGGGELNLSSDIDIVFCHPRGGSSDGPRPLANEQFFTRLARAVVASLADVTADGFCFRVDTRLRPFGDSGPLTCSFGAMEQYYQREGRDWERYALVKARPVAGDLAAGKLLLNQLRPFVYRRYIDFGAVAAMREMLASIQADAARRGHEQDLKRGPGGIREIEFLVQCAQLLRGGREPELRTPSLLEALGALENLGVFPSARAAALRADYHYLRRLENAVQALHDEQTHSLPEGPDLARVSRVTGVRGPEELLAQLAGVRERVRAQLEESFPRPSLSDQAAEPWPLRLQQLDPDGHTGNAGPSGAAPESGLTSGFQAALQRQALSQRGAERLDQFMPLMLDQLEQRPLAPPALKDVLELVLAISRRSAYLSLLVENPPALRRMLDLFQQSGWIARTVIRHPALLDELIDPALGQQLPDAAELAQGTRRILTGSEDLEAAVQALSYLKLSCSLRLAVAELQGALPASAARLRLTRLAEALLEAALALSVRGMQERHGSLPAPGLAVMGYGTLGAEAMGYASDLDLVFLFEGLADQSDGERALPRETWHTRQVRRILALLTTASPAGRLYEVDTRLRPNGRSGLLVSSLAAFSQYQAGSAWTWELQALVRARPVAGDTRVGAEFLRIRESVLALPRPAASLQQEVRDMRQRMRAELKDSDPFKHGPGALVDIDFVAQLGCLSCAHSHPALLRHTGTPALLAGLAACGWLTGDEADVLTSTHAALAEARQLGGLLREPLPAMPDCSASQEICARFLA